MTKIDDADFFLRRLMELVLLTHDARSAQSRQIERHWLEVIIPSCGGDKSQTVHFSPMAKQKRSLHVEVTLLAEAPLFTTPRANQGRI